MCICWRQTCFIPVSPVHPTLLACQPNQLIPFLMTSHTLLPLLFLAYSSPNQVGQPVGKDAFAPLRWIPSLPRVLDPQRGSYDHKPKTLLSKPAVQTMVDMQNHSLYPLPAGLRKLPGFHGLDHYPQSHIVTLGTLQVSPVALFMPIWKSSRGQTSKPQTSFGSLSIMPQTCSPDKHKTSLT